MLYRTKTPSLLREVGKERVKVTLIFAPAKKYKWLNYILEPGFAHVRAVVHLDGVDVLVDPRVAYTSIHCYPTLGKIEPNEGETLVYVDRLIDIYKMRRVFGPLNCVETVKGLIGLSKPGIFTPYQLYKEVSHGQHILSKS